MIVVDCNILVYRLIPGINFERTRRLVQHDPFWTAPTLWRSELRNVLTGYLRRGSLSLIQAEDLMEEGKRSLLAGERTISDRVIFELVKNSNCTSYDCEYVALALTLNIFLITEDRALLHAFPLQCLSIEQALEKNL